MKQTLAIISVILLTLISVSPLRAQDDTVKIQPGIQWDTAIVVKPTHKPEHLIGVRYDYSFTGVSMTPEMGTKSINSPVNIAVLYTYYHPLWSVIDIFGIQEADLRIQEELPALTGEYTDKYAWWFFSPYSQDGNGDKAQGIVYDSTRFSMKESHYFWLSETPDTMSSAWDEKKYNRGACCFIFNDKNTGKDFFAMVIHAPLAKEASAKCVDVVMQQYEKYNPDGLPAVFVGDFNAKPDSPASKHDYVYFRGEGIEPLDYECVNTQYDGIWPSDHCPVYAVLKMK